MDDDMQPQIAVLVDANTKLAEMLKYTTSQLKTSIMEAVHKMRETGSKRDRLDGAYEIKLFFEDLEATVPGWLDTIEKQTKEATASLGDQGDSLRITGTMGSIKSKWPTELTFVKSGTASRAVSSAASSSRLPPPSKSPSLQGHSPSIPLLPSDPLLPLNPASTHPVRSRSRPKDPSEGHQEKSGFIMSDKSGGDSHNSQEHFPPKSTSSSQKDSNRARLNTLLGRNEGNSKSTGNTCEENAIDSMKAGTEATEPKPSVSTKPTVEKNVSKKDVGDKEASRPGDRTAASPTKRSRSPKSSTDKEDEDAGRKKQKRTGAADGTKLRRT